MKSEEQRIAIAEACGWLDIHRGSRKRNRTPEGNTLWATKDAPTINYGREYSVVPDYLNDLNAMHEVEKVLNVETFEGVYAPTLETIVRRDKVTLSRWLTCHATAAQRAEAFLRTLNLWTL